MNEKRLLRVVPVVLVVGMVFSAVGCRGVLRRGADADRESYQADGGKLTDPDPLVRAGEQMRIMQAGVGAVASLEALAREGEDRMRRAAVRVLGQLAQAEPKATEACVEVLAKLYMKKDAVSPEAAVALQDLGRPAVRRLAEALADLPAGAAEGPPPWRHPLALMLQLDEDVALDVLVGMLKNEAVPPETPPPAQNFTLVMALRSATQQSFSYDPNAEVSERQAAVENWRSWWKVQRARVKD